MHSESVVVPRPLSVIEAHLWTVTNWAGCLGDVVSVRRFAHERYAMQVRCGRQTAEVLVAVRWNARHHRFTWKALDGSAWSGELRLVPVNGRSTRVHLTVVAAPRTLVGRLSELVGRRRRDLAADLERIGRLIGALPEPVRPSRLEVGAPVAELEAPALIETSAAAIETRPTLGV